MNWKDRLKSKPVLMALFFVLGNVSGVNLPPELIGPLVEVVAGAV